MRNAFWSSQHGYSRSRGYFEPFGELTAFFDVGDFFQKITFFSIFLLKTPFMYERNYENKLGGNISIIFKVHASHEPLAAALCIVYQYGPGENI